MHRPVLHFFYFLWFAGLYWKEALHLMTTWGTKVGGAFSKEAVCLGRRLIGLAVSLDGRGLAKTVFCFSKTVADRPVMTTHVLASVSPSRWLSSETVVVEQFKGWYTDGTSQSGVCFFKPGISVAFLAWSVYFIKGGVGRLCFQSGSTMRLIVGSSSVGGQLELVVSRRETLDGLRTRLSRQLNVHTDKIIVLHQDK